MPHAKDRQAQNPPLRRVLGVDPVSLHSSLHFGRIQGCSYRGSAILCLILCGKEYRTLEQRIPVVCMPVNLLYPPFLKPMKSKALVNFLKRMRYLSHFVTQQTILGIP